MEIVGLVRFEDVNGNHVTDKLYAKHFMLRPFQIAFGGHWYEQNRRDNDAWVYRAKSAQGSMADDPALLEIE